MRKVKYIKLVISGRLFVEYIRLKEKKVSLLWKFFNNKDTDYEKLAKIDSFPGTQF